MAAFPHLARHLDSNLDTDDPLALRRRSEAAVHQLFEGLAIR